MPSMLTAEVPEWTGYFHALVHHDRSHAPLDRLRAARRIVTTSPAEFAFNQGRVALFATLKALGIGPGDEVVLTGFTCVVVANAVRYLGARCSYVDIDPRTYGTDPWLLDAVLSDRTKAVIVQHSFGIPATVGPIIERAVHARIPVVEDCALALGSRYDGKPVGSFGNAAFWSGQWSKPLPVGLGGFLRVNDPRLVPLVERQWAQAREKGIVDQITLAAQFRVRQSLRRLLPQRVRVHYQALDRIAARLGLIKGSPRADEVQGGMPDGFLVRAGALQARAWRKGLVRWQRDIEQRLRIARLYEHRLPNLGYRTVELRPNEDVVFSRYPVRVSNKRELIRLSRRRGVEIGNWMDRPLHEAVGSLERWDYRTGRCPEGEKAAREVINLPTHRGISEAAAERVLQFLRQFGHPA
jgi:dTDP-4-amino-4,6-dideoxygalactose transaminase